MQGAVVNNVLSEASTVPHVIVTFRERQEEDLLFDNSRSDNRASSHRSMKLEGFYYQESTVDVSENVLFTPLKSICVVGLAVVCAPNIMLAVRLVERVDFGNGPPMLMVVLTRL